MKKFAILLASLGVAAAAVPATANAAPFGYGQGWVSINAREANLNARIDQGIRSGALTRGEAVRLRSDLRSLERLEARYIRSRPGLTMAERADLNRRFDALSARVRFDKHNPRHRY